MKQRSSKGQQWGRGPIVTPRSSSAGLVEQAQRDGDGTSPTTTRRQMTHNPSFPSERPRRHLPSPAACPETPAARARPSGLPGCGMTWPGCEGPRSCATRCGRRSCFLAPVVAAACAWGAARLPCGAGGPGPCVGPVGASGPLRARLRSVAGPPRAIPARCPPAVHGMRPARAPSRPGPFSRAPPACGPGVRWPPAAPRLRPAPRAQRRRLRGARGCHPLRRRRWVPSRARRSGCARSGPPVRRPSLCSALPLGPGRRGSPPGSRLRGSGPGGPRRRSASPPLGGVAAGGRGPYARPFYCRLSVIQGGPRGVWMGRANCAVIIAHLTILKVTNQRGATVRKRRFWPSPKVPGNPLSLKGLTVVCPYLDTIGTPTAPKPKRKMKQLQLFLLEKRPPVCYDEDATTTPKREGTLLYARL